MDHGTMTNHPVRKLGRIAIRRGPIAHLEDVQAAEKLAAERDLCEAPMPISGGMRKALHKELMQQSALRWRSKKPYGTARLVRSYGLKIATCPHCRRVNYFDELNLDEPAATCDRCKRPLW
ncbi:hypothetical protein OOZ54_12720 [Rhodopseudomonas palustris]|uniref:hypothetical protein n=1 Tax=Rhodopseudomonas palustris TaxID=1076 RepID=UPI0022F1289C|nr:hypothetical protein [Rhodopseudomonas palustris]WBU27558.1 hypothetical protein OOZ54_12720 [Rhodopseudomonas palustris]